MVRVSYNAYCAISKEGDNDIWTVRPRGVVPLLPLCSQIDVGATVNALLGDTFSRENSTHGSRFHDRDPQFASRILGTMTQSCYIGTRDIRSHVIRGPYCMTCSHLFGQLFLTQFVESEEFLGQHDILLETTSGQLHTDDDTAIRNHHGHGTELDLKVLGQLLAASITWVLENKVRNFMFLPQ